MRLFVSYAHQDEEAVRQVVDLLRAGGHDPWFDQWLLPGEDWQTELLKAIQQCDAFVYALSQESVDSDWCQWEFGKAVQMGKQVIPIRLAEDVELPPVLSRYQYADFSAKPGSMAFSLATARLMGGLTQIAVRIPREDVPALPDPKGIPTGSNSISAVDFDPARHILEITFLNRGVYQYDAVPAETYRDMSAADSYGRYFNQHIRNVFRYRRVR